MTTPPDHKMATAAEPVTSHNNLNSVTGVTAEADVDAADAFATPSALFREHDRLIELQGGDHDTQTIVLAARDLLRKGRPLGWLLEDCVERRECQRILSYWSVFIYRETHMEVSPDLLPFDPNKAPELDDGLFPFRFEDGYADRAQQLSGWRRLLDECEQKLTEHHFVAVIGGSGAGRDVLVNRVLLPLFQRGSARRSEFASSPTWRYCICSPRSNPLSSLVSAVSGSPSPDPAWVAEQVERLRRDEGALHELLDSVAPEPTFLVIEELETLLLSASPKDIQAFLDNVRSVFADARPKHFVVVILRHDRAMHLSTFGSLEEQIRQSQVLMNFTTAELRSFVEEPSGEVGLVFERGVLDKVLVDLQGEPTVLPLLRVTMRRLWRYRDRNRITWESYEKAGAGRAALEHAAEECYAELDDQQRKILPELSAKFVAPEPGGTMVTCDVDRNDMRSCGSPTDVEKVLRSLENADLVRDVSGGRQQTYRIRYEALLTSWPRLMDWLDDYRRVHRRRLRLSEAARLWDTENRVEDRLWSGTLLREYTEGFGRDPSLTSVEKRFLRVGQLREARSRRRWLIVRSSLVALATLAAASILATVLTWNYYLKANINERMLQDALRQIQEGDYSGAITWLSKRAGRVDDSLADRVRRQIATRYCPVPETFSFAEETADESTRSGYLYRDLTPLPNMLGDKFVAVRSNKEKIRVHLFDSKTLGSEVLAEIPASAKPPIDFDSWPVGIAWAPAGNILLLAATELYWSKFDGTSSSVKWSRCEPPPLESHVFTTVRSVQAKSKPDCDLVLALEKQAHQQLGRLRLWGMTYDSGQVVFREFAELSELTDVFSADFSPSGDLLVVLRGEKRDVNGSVEGAQAFEVWHLNATSAVPGETPEWQRKSTAEWTAKAAVNRGASWGWRPILDAEGKPQGSWGVLESGIYYAAFHPSGDALVTATSDGRVNCWGTDPTISPYLEKSIDLGVRVFHVGFANGGRRLITSSRDRVVRVWDYDSLAEIVPRMHHEGSVLRAIDLGRNESPNAKGELPNIAGELLTSTGEILRLWKWCEPVEPEQDSVSGNVAATSVDGRRVLCTCRFPESGNSRFVAEALQGTSGKSTLEPELRIRDVQEGRSWSIPLTSNSGGACQINELKFGESKDRVFLAAAATVDGRGVVFLCHLKADGLYQCARLPHEEGALSSAFTADGKLLATTDQHDYAKIWDVDKVLADPLTRSDEVHQERELNGTLELDGGQVPAFNLKHTSDVVHADFSPVEKRGVYHLVTVSSDGEAALWDIHRSELHARRDLSKSDLTSEQAVGKLYHGAKITHAAWGPNAQLIVTASRDQTARVWDASNTRLIGILRHSRPVVKAQFASEVQIETFGEVELSKSGTLSSKKYSWNLDPTTGECPQAIQELARLGDDEAASGTHLQLLSSRRLVGDDTRLEELKPWELYALDQEIKATTENK